MTSERTTRTERDNLAYRIQDIMANELYADYDFEVMGTGSASFKIADLLLADAHATDKTTAWNQCVKSSQRAREKALDDAAQLAYRICAETRHGTLGDKVSAAIRLIAKEDGK
jgi:hypothetical protein